jgi:hypothetical protein
MKKSDRKLTGRSVRLGVFFLLTTTLFIGATLWSSTKVEANHPVLVEGNCDSPAPGTVLIPQAGGPGSPPTSPSTSGGICGDFDGDGRIGTAEDTDGADRIFGTINAALGPGTGAAAGTGANFNGTITIIASGRFAETLYIGENFTGPGGPGVANPGNVILQAAPGVEAQIDAVLQGDPAGGNTTRQGASGITISYLTNAADRVVILRNLTIRNFETGVRIENGSRVTVDNCRIENNAEHGLRASSNTRVAIINSQFTANGFRVGGPAPTGGNGIFIEGNARARITDTIASNNRAYGILNLTGTAANVVIYQVSTYFNNIADTFNVTIAPNPNAAQ